MTEKYKKTSVIKSSMIKDVYMDNFKQEILNISNLIQEFPYIGMDTEFPGIVYSKENQNLRGFSNYHLTRLNVDILKVIQIGITLCDKDGLFPEETSTWQFNLKFDINSDTHQQSSIQLLISSGIDFESHYKKGIPHLVFGEYFIVSGLVLNPEVYWITFHGIYDFAYLLKVLTNLKLPEIEKDFYDSLELYFCNYFDLRHLIQFSDYSRGSLQKLAIECNIQRVGTQHQAGSDSVVTVMAFFKLIHEVFSSTSVNNYKNVLFHYIEKDDVEFDNNKLPSFYNSGYNSHFNNYRGNIHMYMYPYYNNNLNVGGINNIGAVTNTTTNSAISNNNTNFINNQDDSNVGYNKEA